VKRFIVGLVLLVAPAALVLGLLVPANDEARVGPGTPVPDYAARTIDGSVPERRLADLRGQVVLVNIWATWCPPCLEELPSMQRLWDAYRDRGLRVIAVSIDDTDADDLIREFVSEHGLTFEILHDPAATIMDAFQASGVPQSFLIDRRGIIRLTSFATDWFSAENRADVEGLLGNGG
jgi:peroxiredoxin